jgi:uncharacterized repeat protein (TIGR01451 family)
MKNNYFKTRPSSVLEGKLSLWRNLLLLGFLMLFAHLSTYAQLCPSNLAMTITTVEATSATANDAKIRVSGVAYSNYKVGVSAGNLYTGSFASASLVSGLTNGVIADNLVSPVAAPGTQYTLRVYKNDGSCYTDSTFYLPYVNWNYTPEFIDIEASITKAPAGDAPMGSNVSIFVAVENKGNLDAAGVEFTVAFPAGLTFVSHMAAAGTTYNPATKIWNIGNLAEKPATGQSVVVLEMVFTITTRGIKEITAQNTALTGIDLDSSPVANAILEDDEGQTCITSNLDYCDGDEFTFTLASGIYKGIIWQRSTDNGTTWTDLAPFSTTADYTIGVDSILVIKRPGDYKYIRLAVTGVCGYDGCCPIKVIPGLPPILTKPNDVVVCFGAADTTITSTNIQLGYTTTSNVTYGISAVLPPFLSDQGDFKYQWYDNNGLSNPGTAALAGDTTLTLRNITLPNVVGKYNYRLISEQRNHLSCNDTTEVSFIVNELPVPVATVNSPVCQEDTIFLKARNTAVNPTPGIIWSWTGPNTFTHNDSTQTILNAQPVHEGDYIVRASYTLNGLGCSNSDTVNLKVNLLPAPPVATDTVYCQNIVAKRMSAILRLPAVATTVDSLRWYEGKTIPYAYTDYPNYISKVGHNTGPYPQTASAGQDKWYVTHVDINGCQSHPDTLIVNIDAKPLPPTVRDIAFCENYPSTPLTAVASPGSFGLIWYGLNKTDRDTSATYPAPPTNVIGVFSYYVSQYSFATTPNGVKRGGCESDTVKLDVYIKDTPLAPAVVPQTYCLLDTPTPLVATPVITNTGTGVGSNVLNVLAWYWAGDTTSVTPTPSTALAGATWYYVSQTTSYDTLKCESPQAPLKVTVNPLPVASMIPVSALCVGTVSQNNGQLILTRYRDSDLVSWNIGSAYASVTPTAFVSPGAGGVFASGLSNPATATQDYTAQIKNVFGCTINVTAPLVAKDCTCPGGYCEPASVAKTK